MTCSSNGSDNPVDFTTYMNKAIVCKPYSSVALASLGLKLLPDQIEVVSGQNQLAWATVDGTDPGNNVTYNELIAAHTITIPEGSYYANDLMKTLTDLFNDTMYWSDDQPWLAEQGGEILVSLDGGKMRWTFAGSRELQYAAPASGDVNYDTGTYSYATAGNPSLGTFTRTAGSVDTPDSILYTDGIFCRGSGQISMERDADTTYCAIGLVRPSDISDDIMETIANMKYGVGIFNGIPGYINDTWYTFEDGLPIEVGAAASETELSITLGKSPGEDYSLVLGIGADVYPMSYVRDNYILIMSVQTNGGALEQIRWTPSKIANVTDGYYGSYNPSIFSADDKVVPSELGFIANNTVCTLDLVDLPTASVLGFTKVRNITPSLGTAPNNIASVTGYVRIDLGYSYPESINVWTNIPVESYLNGRPSYIIASFPIVEVDTNTQIALEPATPQFIALNNSVPQELNELRFKLLDKSGHPINVKAAACTISVFIRDE